MNARNYICVFRADPNVDDNVVDLGQDPDFSPPVPTWGICRPQVRAKWVSVGSYVVFIGYALVASPPGASIRTKG